MEIGGVEIISRRMVQPDRASSHTPEPESVHLTPWDLRRITVDYIQKGVVLPKPPAGGQCVHAVEHLASSLSRAIAGRFYPLAGRFAVAADANDRPGRLTISLRCNDEGVEFVHAVAPGITVADITGSLNVIPRVVWSFFPLTGMLGTDAALDATRPVLAAQVTVLADGIFVAMSLNHGAVDGTTFWDLFNAWSEISRSSAGGAGKGDISNAAPARWFLDGCTVPIPLPFTKVEDIARRFEYPPVQECSLRFSPESVKKLKARANADMAATATISSLQAVLALIWRAVCRARALPPSQETTCALPVGCRTRLKGMPKCYVGNAVAGAVGRAAVDEILGDDRLGWAAWLLNRAVASVDEASVRRELASWPENPSFKYVGECGADPPTAAVVVTGSPRFDVYGNDFGWGRPVGVRSGAGNKLDGMVTVYEGGGGGVELEVCLAPGALARLVADEELMEAL